MDKIARLGVRASGRAILTIVFIIIVSFLNGCGTTQRKNETETLPVKDKVRDTWNETIGLLEKKGNGTDKIIGYTSPGMPLRLTGKVIRIYIAPMKSPMGRLIGEHYVWAIVQEESWWTPGETGLDTIVPSDIFKKKIPDKEKK
ncbi:MAG TPA: TraV family lipoprotein [Dissulfurispiraceae bacterium]|nr:TraV family lipoprotein [Dissulfurispiraceae bacterium]